MLAGNLLFTGGCLNADEDNVMQRVGTESGDFERQINHREFTFSRGDHHNPSSIPRFSMLDSAPRPA
jgi:hypothetical protein